MLLFRLYIALKWMVTTMDYRKELLLASAARLYSLGIDVEAARERLRQLVEQGVPFSSPEMEQAYLDYQELNRQWRKLETDHLDLRREILRSHGQRMVEEAQKGWDSAERDRWLTLEEVEAPLLSSPPNEETTAALREAEQISKDSSVKGYRDMDELFASLRSDSTDPQDVEIQARIEAAQSLFGCIPGEETLEQAKKERLDRI